MRRKHRGLATATIVCLMMAAPVPADIDGRLLTGTVYDLDSPTRVLYRWELKQCPDRWVSNYIRPDGSIAVTDETRFHGERFEKYSYYRPTTGERSSVTLHDSVARFEHEEFGTRKTKQRTIDGVFLAGHVMPQFIQDRLDDFKNGKEFNIRYGVLGKMKDYGFRLTPIAASRSNELTVQMEALSPMVRLVADPVTFTFSEDGHLLRVSGRLLPMEPENGKLRPVDGTLVVTADAPLVCPPAQRAAREAPLATP